MNLLAQGTITAEEFLRLPEADFCELVDGHLVEKTMGAESSYICIRLATLLGTFCENPFRGWIFGSETGYQFLSARPNLVRKPDLSFVRQGRLSENHPPAGHLRLAPDLAVEIVSLNDLYYEVEQKVMEYRSGGVPLVWIVVPPTRTVLIRRADGNCAEVGVNGELSGEDVLPGFRCAVSALFQHVRPATAPAAEPA